MAPSAENRRVRWLSFIWGEALGDRSGETAACGERLWGGGGLLVGLEGAENGPVDGLTEADMGLSRRILGDEGSDVACGTGDETTVGAAGGALGTKPSGTALSALMELRCGELPASPAGLASGALERSNCIAVMSLGSALCVIWTTSCLWPRKS